jgi:hypothetical protein
MRGDFWGAVLHDSTAMHPEFALEQCELQGKRKEIHEIQTPFL